MCALNVVKGMNLSMKKRIEQINYIFLLILPFLDIVTALSTRFIDLPVSFGIIIKGLYTVSLALYIIFFCKSKERKHFIYYLIAIFSYCLLFILTKKHIWGFNLLLSEIIALYKYLFTGFILFSYIVIYRNKESSKMITRVMFYTLICYTVLLVFPEVTNTSFNSYTTKPNQGSVGWFYAANEISAIMLMLFPIYFSKLKDMINNKRYWYLILIIPIIYAIYLLGTKSSWFGLILICIVALLVFSFKDRKNKKLILFLIITSFFVFLLNIYSPATENFDKRLDNATKVTNKVNKNTNTTTTKKPNKTVESSKSCGKYHKIKEIISNKTIIKTIHVFLSGRENKAYTQYLIYKDSSLSNKLLGLGFINSEEIDNCYINLYVEIDLVDSIIHFGIIGFIILLTPFIYLISLIDVKKLKKIDSINMLYIFTFILIIGLSFMSGHILGYPSPSIYLCLLLMLIINNINNLELRK